MALRRGSRTARPEAGFALIEVVVSALIMVTVTGGVVKLISASGRTGADQRHRAQAYSVAQEDQARMRGMQISSLNHFKEKEVPVKVGNDTYLVTSEAFFVNDATAEASCGAGNNSADYVRIISKVDWAGRPAALKAVTIESIVSPATGSLDPTHGALAVEVLNAASPPQGISGVSLNGSGPAPFAGSTDSTGCALFPDLPEGEYALTPSLATGFVDEKGEAPKAIPAVGVVRGGTVSEVLHYDLEEQIELAPTVKAYAPSTSLIPNPIDSARLTNPGWSGSGEKTVTPGPIAAPPKNTQLIGSLYPFGTASEYGVYAGSCSLNKPPTGVSIDGAALTRANPSPVAATIQLPALYLTVKEGSAVAEKARVVIDEDTCSGGEWEYLTNPKGQLDYPGLPWGTYDICASKNVFGFIRHTEVTNREVHSTGTGTVITLTLTSSSPSGGC